MQSRKGSDDNVQKTEDFYTQISSVFPDDLFRDRTVKECPIVYGRDKRRCRRRFDTSDWKDVAASFLSQWKSKRPHNTASNVHVEFDTRISSRSSANNGISRSNPRPRGRPRRKCTQGSALSDNKVVSASSCSRIQDESASVLRQPLSNKLLDHCFRTILKKSPEERKDQFTYINCLWFDIYTKEDDRERVLSWIKRDNIFSKRYIFIPILMWSHWSLLILCHLGENLDSKTKTPCILLLDSLHTYGSPPKLKPIIRRFVSDIFESEGRPKSKDRIQKIPFLVPKVPQQRNDKECGIFVLYYANLFLESAPERFSISHGYPYFLKEDWFTMNDVERFYESLESLSLESSDSGENRSSDSKGVEFLYTEK